MASYRDHFAQPHGLGPLSKQPGSVLTARGSNPVCGDELQWSARLQGSVIEELRFEAQACSGTIACASVLVMLAQGGRVEAAKALTKEAVLEQIPDLPSFSKHGLDLALGALHDLLKQGRGEPLS